MLSYHNDPLIKEKHVRRFAAHRVADEVIQGTGFHDNHGCFVGCTLDEYNHAQFPIQLGWPVWLASLADVIFENLPREEAAQFGTDLLNAVPVGVDLEPVRYLTAVRRMTTLIVQQKKLLSTIVETEDRKRIKDVIKAIRAVRQCNIEGADCSFDNWTAAYKEARVVMAAATASFGSTSMKSSCVSAAASATQATEEETTFLVQYRMIYSASHAAYAAFLVGSALGQEKAWKRERDDLLDILWVLQ